MLHPLIAEHLTPDDDPNLWDVATTILLSDAAAKAAVGVRDDVYAQIGCCHHWISPHHPIRWKADGGFAWPFGYDKTTTGFSYTALPAFTWSESLRWTGDGWVPGRTGRRCIVFRVAIPARSSRHRQAAVHTIWMPRLPAGREKVVHLFGFRKRKRAWSLTASEALQHRR